MEASLRKEVVQHKMSSGSSYYDSKREVIDC